MKHSFVTTAVVSDHPFNLLMNLFMQSDKNEDNANGKNICEVLRETKAQMAGAF
jgi:hypothetical protein